jgi:hypothetical protein
MIRMNKSTFVSEARRKSSSKLSASADRRFQFHKCSQLFIRSHNETLSVVAMRVHNEDCSLVRIRLRRSPNSNRLRSDSPQFY